MTWAPRSERLAETGNARMDEGRYVDALATFRAGGEALPRPRAAWEAAEWFLAGMGDSLWHLGWHPNALPIWRDVLLMQGLGNPFVHPRRGRPANVRERRSHVLELRHGADEATEGRDRWEGFEGVSRNSALYEWLMDPGVYD